jgi:hypothetical protein
LRAQCVGGPLDGLLIGEGEFHAQSVTSLLHDSLLEWDRAD